MFLSKLRNLQYKSKSDEDYFNLEIFLFQDYDKKNFKKSNATDAIHLVELTYYIIIFVFVPIFHQNFCEYFGTPF